VAPATVAGPPLSVDAGNQTRAISPYIYGVNAYLLDSTTAKNINVPIDRWGGDSTSRYNYLLDVTNQSTTGILRMPAVATETGCQRCLMSRLSTRLGDGNNSIGRKTLGTCGQGWGC